MSENNIDNLNNEELAEDALTDETTPTSEEVLAEIEEILGESIDEFTIVMEDSDTGVEYTFYFVDDFEFEDSIYAILVNVEESPEAVIAKVTTDEDGNMGFTTVVDDEFDRVSAHYEMLSDEAELEDEK